MNEEDLITPLFVEDTSVSPLYTKWFPSWVWYGRDTDGRTIWFSWAIARWKVKTGAMFVTTTEGPVQSGPTTHAVERQLRRMTPGNILLSDIDLASCLLPRGDLL